MYEWLVVNWGPAAAATVFAVNIGAVAVAAALIVVAQRLRGLTTSPIATGWRLLSEFFAFGPDDSGATP